MAYITTTTRRILVKEKLYEFLSKAREQFIFVTEISYLENSKGEVVKHEGNIIINKNFIIEIEPENE